MVLNIKLFFRWLALLSIYLWAAMSAGCGKPAMVGLHPDNPPVSRKGLSLLTEFVKVDTLTPTFRWQPLTIRTNQATRRESAKIDNLTYEIRIWRTISRDGGKLVYRREKLITTEHRVEKPLDPGTRYYWSVRAHFEIDGVDRTTEWALAGYLLRSEAVPNDSCLRFKTPEKPSKP
jgi:hypothetical protein